MIFVHCYKGLYVEKSRLYVKMTGWLFRSMLTTPMTRSYYCDCPYLSGIVHQNGEKTCRHALSIKMVKTIFIAFLHES